MKRASPLLVAALVLTLATPAAAKFPQSVDATVQPGGTVSETSSTVPKDAESATIKVTPDKIDSDDFFNSVRSVVTRLQSKKHRLVLCVGLYQHFSDLYDEDVEADIVQPNLRLLFLAACLELASRTGTTNARAAATSCPSVPVAAPAEISRASGGYRMTIDGTAKKPTRRPLRVGCRRVKGTMRIKLRPRKRTRSLRSAVGRNLAIGFYNTGDSPVSMRTTFNVR